MVEFSRLVLESPEQQLHRLWAQLGSLLDKRRGGDGVSGILEVIQKFLIQALAAHAKEDLDEPLWPELSLAGEILLRVARHKLRIVAELLDEVKECLFHFRCTAFHWRSLPKNSSYTRLRR